MKYIAIDHTEEGHHKHQGFHTRDEAQTHIDSGELPNGFVALNPGGNYRYWAVDPVLKTVTLDSVTEAKVTATRVWEAEMQASDAELIKGLARTIEDYFNDNPDALARKTAEYKAAHAARAEIRGRRPS